MMRLGHFGDRPRAYEFICGGWRAWLLFGRNKPMFQAEHTACRRCYLFHVPFVSLALVNWEAL